MERFNVVQIAHVEVIVELFMVEDITERENQHTFDLLVDRIVDI